MDDSLTPGSPEWDEFMPAPLPAKPLAAARERLEAGLPAPAQLRRRREFADAFRKQLRPWFDPPSSWWPWLVAGKVLFADPLTAKELEFYQACTGRMNPPSKPFREAWFDVGRRGGKGWFAAAVAIYIACMRKHRLKKGDQGVVMLIAADRDQAAETFRYCRELIDSVAEFKALLAGKPTQDRIDLINQVSIQIRTASWRTIRGRKVLAVIADEIATWWNDATSANPDREILTAIRPSMLDEPGVGVRPLICISSPHARQGTMWDAFNKYYAQDDAKVLFWKAPTWVMHPGVDREFLAEEKERDPIAFDSEFGAEFRKDLESYISIETLEAVTVPDRLELPYVGGEHCCMFDGASGTGQESQALAIARPDRTLGKAVLVYVKEWRPPFSSTASLDEAVQIARQYRCTEIIGDMYAYGIYRDLFQQRGMSMRRSEDTKSDLFRKVLPLMTGGLVELLDIPRMRNQFVRLERRTSPSGSSKDIITHPRGGFDDVANSVAGALVLAGGRLLRGGDAVPLLAITRSTDGTVIIKEYGDRAAPAPAAPARSHDLGQIHPQARPEVVTNESDIKLGHEKAERRRQVFQDNGPAQLDAYDREAAQSGPVHCRYCNVPCADADRVLQCPTLRTAAPEVKDAARAEAIERYTAWKSNT